MALTRPSASLTTTMVVVVVVALAYLSPSVRAATTVSDALDLTGKIPAEYDPYFSYSTGRDAYPTGTDYYTQRILPPACVGLLFCIIAIIGGPIFCCVRCCNCGCGCGCCGAGGAKPTGYSQNQRCCLFILYLVVLCLTLCGAAIAFVGNGTTSDGLTDFSSDVKLAFNNQQCFTVGSNIVDTTGKARVTAAQCSGTYAHMATKTKPADCNDIFKKLASPALIAQCRLSMYDLIDSVNGKYTLPGEVLQVTINLDKSNVVEASDSINDASKTITDNTDKIADYNDYRWIAMVALLAVCVFFALWGLLSWICSSGCPAMSMVIFCWILMFIVWLLFSVHFIFSIFVDDTCYFTTNKFMREPSVPTFEVVSNLKDFVKCTDKRDDVNSSMRKLYGRGACSETGGGSNNGIRDWIVRFYSRMQLADATKKNPSLTYDKGTTEWRQYTSNDCVLAAAGGSACGGNNACAGKNVMMDYPRNVEEFGKWVTFVTTDLKTAFGNGGEGTWSVQNAEAVGKFYELMIDISLAGSCELEKETYETLTNGLCSNAVKGTFWIFGGLGLIGVCFIVMIILGTKGYKQWNPKNYAERIDEENQLYGTTTVELEEGTPMRSAMRSDAQQSQGQSVVVGSDGAAYVVPAQASASAAIFAPPAAVASPGQPSAPLAHDY
jgi:hypothetical protein